jgi:ferredoxin
MTAQHQIYINNNPFSFNPGETILEVAARNHIDIPTLCHLKGTTPTGACRICVVEIEGTGNLIASCSTPAAHGMVIQTESPRVITARKTVLQLMLPRATTTARFGVRTEKTGPNFSFGFMPPMEARNSARCGGIAGFRIWHTGIRYPGKVFPPRIPPIPWKPPTRL